MSSSLRCIRIVTALFRPKLLLEQVVRDEQRRAELIKKNGKEITSIMHVIAYNTTSRTITGEARDALIELIMKNGAWDELVRLPISVSNSLLPFM